MKSELTLFELHDGEYATVAQTTAALTLSHPFTVTADPVKLVSKLRR